MSLNVPAAAFGRTETSTHLRILLTRQRGSPDTNFVARIHKRVSAPASPPATISPRNPRPATSSLENGSGGSAAGAAARGERPRLLINAARTQPGQLK
ncbi:hypothetical protein EVAR_69789_1 [Eumeta japonica]|uniref:Uncharacterized protein n=1 Tax=Eumeta variegata TaxID=151549 RepID=A0A4C2A6Q2_EUMVA|nr:hypothetical protein EVAR_69789_1 [Eumeta japonica]